VLGSEGKEAWWPVMTSAGMFRPFSKWRHCHPGPSAAVAS
jgi:hypothetical protein